MSRWNPLPSKPEKERARRERREAKAERLRQRRAERQRQAVENLTGHVSGTDPTDGGGNGP